MTNRRLTALALVALALAAAPGLRAEGPTAGAAVVILNGLAGDVESERAYDEQMQALLVHLARPGSAPAALFVLADDPERVRVPGSLAAQLRKASRAALLELSREALPAGAPVTVFAWGHAGTQGATPVFHVRGPRPTPDDFAALAQAWRDRPQRWALFFRGSGRFARAIAGSGRSVLSSDDEASSGTDPVGFELLVKALGDLPTASFDAIAGRVGRATAAWYARNGMARTEEPVLRVDGTAPVRLAAAASPEEPEAADSTAEAPPGPPVPGPEWNEITPVDPAKYPGASAVVLRRDVRTTLGDNPALVQEVDEFVQVLTEEGESAADLDIAFSPPGESLTLLHLELRRPDGTLERVDPDDVHDVPRGGLDPYPAPSRKVFSIPGAAPGAVVRVHRRNVWKTFPMPHLLLEVEMAGALPVRDLRIEVRTASRFAFHHAFTDGVARPPARGSSAHGSTYSWRLQDLPAVPAEPLQPSAATARLLASTFPDWAAFSGWYRRLIREADQLTPELRARSDEVTRGAASDLEKVERLYRFVTQMRYVAVPLGVNSHRPHAAAGVLRNGYGDCKDKANLLNTLLRAQAIPADLVLVPRFQQAYPEVPGAGFNHAISRVRLAGQELFLDTTDPFSRFGLLPPGDPGRRVLVVDDATRELTRLPAPLAQDHRLTLTATLDAPAAGAVRNARLRATATGYADYTLRAIARAAGSGASVPLLGLGYRPASGAFALDRQSYGAPTALDAAFDWRSEGVFTGTATALPGGAWLQRAPFWLPREWDDALHARRSPLSLNSGYPLTLEQALTLALPAGAGRVVLPPLRERTSGPLRFRVGWTQDAGGLLASLRVEVPSAELSGEDARAFVDGLQALWAALAEGAVYTVS